MERPDPRDQIHFARRAVEQARQAAELARIAAERAERAGRRAEVDAEHEVFLRSTTAAAEACARVARAHRRAEKSQRRAADVFRKYELMLSRHVVSDFPDTVPPAFMAAVANAARWQGAVLTLSDRSGTERLVAASDARARRAHEAEMTVAEGPSLDAMSGAVPIVSGVLLDRRWPRFGPLARDLGVQVVAAVPLSFGPDKVGGSLTVLDSTLAPTLEERPPLAELAEALTVIALRAAGGNGAIDEASRMEPFEQEDFQPAMHQAAGVLCEHGGWKIPDAIALIRAHAFAQNRSVADIADEVLRGELRF